MDKPKIKLDINQYVYVRLTDKARQFLRDEYQTYWREAAEQGLTPPGYAPPAYVEPTQDEDGFSGIQLWMFMEKFGPAINMTTDLSLYFKDGTALYFDAPRPAAAPDAIRPDHYTPGQFEAIKVMRAWATPEQYQGFLRLTALKYISRMGKKGPALEDVKKARQYLDWLIGDCGGR